MLLHVLLYVRCIAMPPLQGAVRPDTLRSWVSVSRGSDGTGALLKWKDIEGAVKDIEYQEVVSKAADQAWRAPSRLLALHLLTDTLVPELLRANLQASDELCAVRSYGVALAMLPGPDQRRILREAGCDEDADLTTMEGIPLISYCTATGTHRPIIDVTSLPGRPVFSMSRQPRADVFFNIFS